MDYRILELFIKENDAWEDMIRRQKLEVPVLDALISNIVADKQEMKEDRTRTFQFLHQEMQKAQHSMEELEQELIKQQQYLSSERKRKITDPYSIDTFSSQNILRDRIRDVERRFVELKCNYLNYVATI